MCESIEACIFNIQRFSTEDGPGIRTTVFFKGCPLNCSWCHNPEGISKGFEIVWLEARCIGCGDCLVNCPNGAIKREFSVLETDRTKCDTCGKCADVCPANARELIGRMVSVDDLVKEVEKDRVFYETSGGGVTVSGGDPCMQATFVEKFLKACRHANLHTALDSSGCCPSEVMEKVAAHADMILYDLKLYDSQRHKRLTGVSNELIIENLHHLVAAGKRIWVRIPIIPGCTDDKDNIEGIGRILRPLKAVERIDLLGYHKLAEDKYRRLYKPYPMSGAESPSDEMMLQCADILRINGVETEIRYQK